MSPIYLLVDFGGRLRIRTGLLIPVPPRNYASRQGAFFRLSAGGVRLGKPQNSPEADGSPTQVYTALSSINPEFVAIATELQRVTSVGAYHLGDMPIGTELLSL